MSTATPPALELQPTRPECDRARLRLLVSVRDSHEAHVARLSGVDWIDLKNPDAGALGAASSRTAAAVAHELSSLTASAQALTSAAVGELRDRPAGAATALARYFPLLKVGLSGLAGRQAWSAQLAEFSQTVGLAGAQLVPVIYADHEACHAPTPIQVLEATAGLEQAPDKRPICSGMDLTSGGDGEPTYSSAARYLLIDTYTKDGRGLLDWIELDELESIVQQANASGRQTVLAGSLKLHDLPHLMGLPVAAIGVRGAVCTEHRRSDLCPVKLRQWVELFSAR